MAGSVMLVPGFKLILLLFQDGTTRGTGYGWKSHHRAAPESRARKRVMAKVASAGVLSAIDGDIHHIPP